jgi:hypothetical protein
MLLRFFSASMNADGSLPTARWMELWTALYKADDIGRPWCHHRYAAMRNYLSGKGLLTWEDPGYLIGGAGRDGRYVPGKAAKWCASEDLMAAMEAMDRENDQREPECIIPGRDASDSLMGKREEEEDILYGCKPSDKGEGRDILHECNPSGYSILTLALERHRSRLEVLEQLGIDTWPMRPEFRGHIWDRMRSAAA